MIYKAILFFLLVSLLFYSTKTVGNYSLRSQMYYNLNVPSARTNLGNKAFKYSAPTDWNSLQI